MLPPGFTPLPPEEGLRAFRLGAPAPGRLPLVLLPGIEGDSRIWAGQTALARDRTVVAMDLPAGGDLEALARAVLARLEALPERAAPPLGGMQAPFGVLGASLGGLVARALAHVAPDRVRTVVTLGALPSPALLPPRIRRGRQVAGLLPAPLFAATYRRRIRRILAEEGLDPTLAAALLDRLPARDPWLARLDAVLAWGLPPRCAVPLLALRGQADAEAAWTAADLIRALPGATFQELPGGHRAMATHGQAFNEAVRAWLATVGQ